jgi:sugar phosphate permease
MVQGNGEDTNRSWIWTRRWLTVAPAMLLLWVIGQIDKTHISLIIADRNFLQELSLTGSQHATELGGLMSTFFIGYGIAIFLWGFLVDRFGPRACAVAGTLLWGAVLLMSSRVGDINHYLAIRFLLGLAEGNLWPVCNALTNRWFPAREHSRIQAFWIAGSTLGTAAGVPLVTALMLASGWRGALAALAVVSMTPILFFAFFTNWPRQSRSLSRTELDEIEQGRKPITTASLHFGELFKSRAFWLVAVCQFVSATMIYTIIQWVPSYFTRYHQMPFPQMAARLTLGFVIATLLTFVIGWIADHTMQRALTGAWTCAAFALLVIPAALLFPLDWSAVALTSLTCCAASTAALNGALMQALVRPEAIARGTGLYVGVGNLSSAIGPALFGWLIQQLNGEYWAGFVFLSILGCLGIVTYVMLHRMAQRVALVAVADISRERAAVS